jgi:hypothetical protein
MSRHRKTKVQQILERFEAGEYQVDPGAVAGSVIRRMSIPRSAGSSGSGSSVRRPGEYRIRGIVSVDRGRARVATF